MSEIRAWLEGLGLGQYAEAFVDGAIGFDLLPELDHDVLKDLGVSVPGHRLKIFRAARGKGPGVSPTALGPTAEAETDDPADPRITPDAERRQLTVMFCDLVGSTALSEKLDPEDLREVMRAYQDACAGAIKRFDGYIAQTLGDGLMVYFGYPIAHEDDAQRAVRAGLNIVGAIEALSRRLEPEQGVMIDVRIGIHTGLVVAGEVGGADTRGDMAVVGETPNIAARIESLAVPGTVTVGERTRRLVGDVFDFEDMGAHDVKGLSTPLALYRAKAERAADSRFEAMHPAGLTPFVGRDEEIALLLSRWNTAKGGEGQVVLLEGEPGIGKSRITNTVRELISGDDHTRLQYQCSPFYTNSAFYPIITQVERAAGFQTEDSSDTRLDKLEALIETDEPDTLALIAAVLSLPTERYPASNMTPEKQRERTIEVLVERLAKLASRSPILLVFEDVHWIDPTSLEALDQIMAAIDATPVLVLVTFRPEFEPQWGAHSHVTLISLNRLGKRQSGLMVDRVTGDKPLPDDLRDQIVVKTDGVPLFIEELTKAVTESDIVTDDGDRYELSGAVDSLAIPDTLHDSLMARLDKLIPVKEVAQVGAAIGREFSHQLVALLSPMSEADLDAALDKLVASQLVYRRGTPPEATYTFKHALVQDAAYDSLLKRDRQNLHKEIAKALETNFPHQVEDEPELIAHHYTEAGLAEISAPYWLNAGQRATARTALMEAVEHLRTGLSEAQSVPPSTARDQIELEIRSAMGTAYMALKGWAAPEVEATMAPAVSLSNKLNEYERRLEVLWWLWLYYVCLPEFEMALERVEQMFDIANKTGRSDAMLIAHSAGSTTKHWMGDYEGARRHGDEVIRLYDFDTHQDVVQWANHDPNCFTVGWSSHWRWAIGYPDQAAAASDAQLRLARRLDNIFNLGFSLTTGSGAYLLRREPEIALGRIEEAVAISRDQSIPAIELFTANFFGGEAALEAGRPEQAYERMKTALETWHGLNGWLSSSRLMGSTAKALAELGRHDEALLTVTTSLSLGTSKQEGWFEAENHRIKGLILLTKPDPEEAAAEASFKSAIDVARRQKTKSWELRAATSLAKLWQRQNKVSEAHDLLAPVYDWFTEGFGTADLKDAKALLDELN